MNLLYYCSEYPPYKSGGIGTVTKIVAEELVRRGHNVSVIGYYPDINELFFDKVDKYVFFLGIVDIINETYDGFILGVYKFQITILDHSGKGRLLPAFLLRRHYIIVRHTN